MGRLTAAAADGRDAACRPSAACGLQPGRAQVAGTDSTEARQQLAQNRVLQVAVGSVQAFNTVSTRGVKPIGVTGTYRTPRLPEVPTLIEQGLNEPLVALEGGLALMAPAGTPEAILQTLSAVVVKGAATEQAAKLRENFGIPTRPKGLAETRADWERAVPAWIKATVDLAVKLD